jgi:hypothetical protein
MDDHLQEFINQNREAFDRENPPKDIWHRIEHKLENREQKKLIYLWSMRIAAAFIFILCCGIVLGIYIGKTHKNEINYTATPELKKYQETESFYNVQVGLKLNELKDDETKSNVEEDIRQLDLIYEQLKNEMINSNYSNSSVLINAMIKNHKTKVDILENILEKQNKTQNEKVSI